MRTYPNGKRAFLTAVPAFVLGLALATGAAAADFTAQLAASEGAGLPEERSSEQWLEAQGEATATAEGDEHLVEIQASDLVEDGLYTVWWVNPGIVGMEMGPGGGAPENEFRADGEGNAETTLRVPADNDYQMMVVVYHADDQMHGDKPGEMGEVTFEHLSGPWPRPAGEGTM